MKIFCASCWGLGAGKGSSQGSGSPSPAHPEGGFGSVPRAAHRLSCFQRWKKSWAAISVGWKNLLMVTGSFRVRDWGAPPYLAGEEGGLGQTTPSPRNPRLPGNAPPPDSPEAHGQEWGRQEVPQTLDVEHLLYLCPTVHLRGHPLGLHGQLCPPVVKEARNRSGPGGGVVVMGKGLDHPPDGSELSWKPQPAVPSGAQRCRPGLIVQGLAPKSFLSQTSDLGASSGLP